MIREQQRFALDDLSVGQIFESAGIEVTADAIKLNQHDEPVQVLVCNVVVPRRR